jgi:hypothetical protein
METEELPEEGTAERTRLMASALHRRERQAFGGAIQWEAAFFGWLAAIGLAVMLAAMVVGAGVAAGLTEFSERAGDQVEELSFGGGVLLVVIVALAYAAGGYVAARMARFDGWRQGLGVWVLSLLMALAVAIAAWIAGGELNPLDSLELPSLPVDQGPLGSGAGIALAIVAVVALMSAIVGGLLGERFHRAVDEAGTEMPDPAPWEPESERGSESEPPEDEELQPSVAAESDPDDEPRRVVD